MNLKFDILFNRLNHVHMYNTDIENKRLPDCHIAQISESKFYSNDALFIVNFQPAQVLFSACTSGFNHSGFFIFIVRAFYHDLIF